MAVVNKKQCYFCAANIKSADYKSTDYLRKFITPQAQIIKRSRSGICAKHQRTLSSAIKQARFLGILPFVTK